MTEHAELQIGVLKDEWGFDGVIVSDWLAATDCDATATGGLDIVMPAMNSPWGDKLVEAVRAGRVAEELIDDKVRRVLRLAARIGALRRCRARGRRRPTGRPRSTAGRWRGTSRRGRSCWPRTTACCRWPAPRKVALIGALAKHARVLGGGSATVFPDRIISPLDRPHRRPCPTTSSWSTRSAPTRVRSCPAIAE